ncbi:hypothetical protein AB0P15_17105 [Streptomyces sp. NPDC087917]
MYARSPDRAWAAVWEVEARRTLDRAFEQAFGGTPPGLTPTRLVVRDDAVRALCAVAAQPGDLLVVGARPRPRRFGRGGRVGRGLRGRAVCPVLTVPTLPPDPREVRRLRRATPEDFRPVRGASRPS